MQNQNLQKKGNKSQEFGNTTSLLLAGGGYIGTKLVGKKLQKDVNNIFTKELTKNNYLVNNKECRALFKASNLGENGVKLKNVDSGVFKDTGFAEFLSNPSFKTYKKYLKLNIENSSYNMAVTGENACYDTVKKKIFVNCDKSGIFLPHEMGHAMNNNSKNPLLKLLSKGRVLQYFTPAILAIALFRKPKQEGEESNTAIGKTLDYVKENSVGLTAACWAPTIIEEGIASIRGVNFAKKYLSPEKIAAIKKTNFKAWLTYVAAAGVAIGAVYVVNKIRNATAPKNEPQKNTEQAKTQELNQIT